MFKGHDHPLGMGPCVDGEAKPPNLLGKDKPFSYSCQDKSSGYLGIWFCSIYNKGLLEVMLEIVYGSVAFGLLAYRAAQPL